MFSSEEKLRYSRHLLLDGFGELKQQKLKQARVLIIGAGGLGCPVSLYLAGAGVGHLTILDFDTVSSSNLQRQIAFNEADIGKPKAEVLAEQIRAKNSFIKVSALVDAFTTENAQDLLEQHDLVVDGSDNFVTRYLVNDASYLYKKPLIFAAVAKFSGQVSIFNKTAESPCYRCLFPQSPDEELSQNCADAGVLGALVGVLGTMQASEAIKVICDLGNDLDGKFSTYDMLSAQMNSFTLRKNPKCQLCGEKANITSLSAQKVVCEIEAGIELSADELKEKLAKSAPMTLIDIREENERKLFPLPVESLHIPMTELKSRMEELKDDELYCTVCQFGDRARKARLILQKKGYEALNLKDGLDDFFALYK